jgi:hypothetical protein
MSERSKDSRNGFSVDRKATERLKRIAKRIDAEEARLL